MPPPVEGPSSFYITPEAALQCAEEISMAGNVEVFFIGRRDEHGLVAEVESHAYGTVDCVPALTTRAEPGNVLLHNHPSGYLMPSEPDMNVASAMGQMGVGFYIIDNGCTRCRVVVKAQDARRRVPIDEKDVVRRLTPGSDLSKVVEGFEDRPQQREMALSATRAFNNNGISIIEAGTGTGKSLAYLLPSLLYALKNNERVVVSTNTINLQEQLVHKDIPALRRVVTEPFEVELVKGRGNYVCKRKAEYAREEGGSLLLDDFQRELSAVLQWAKESPTGDRQDLPFQTRYEVWERVQSEADNCLRVRCPFYEECFFYNSRRRAARARILIVNHSLLISDLAVRRATGNYTGAAVLPPYSRVVLDEAHHLEEVATRNLAQTFTRIGIRTMLSRLHRRDSSGDGGRGVLDNLYAALNGLCGRQADPRLNALLIDLIDQVFPAVGDLRENLEFMLNDFSHFFQQLARITMPSPEEVKIRITAELRQDPLWRAECRRLVEDMAIEVARFVARHREQIEKFGELEDEDQNLLINPLLEWQAIVGRLDEVRKVLLKFIEESEGLCQWVEMAQRNNQREPIIRLCIAPVQVNEVLREALHDRMKSEVLTSATLSVDHAFRFFQERCGIPMSVPPQPEPVEYDEDGMPISYTEPMEARSVETHLLPTPFNYRKQVFFGVPSDMPDPREPTFVKALAELINRSVAISGGRAFILFTSYGQLRQVADLCEPTIRRLGIEVLRQGQDHRDSLLRRFREDETSVLFATSSFWEGVDVRGRALELLILARLPFSVPKEPIQEAQYEALERQGRDPFKSLVVPRAIIRFKQGFGRLIRARTDRGAILVADRRLITMPYGRQFLNSLPDLELRKFRMPDLMNSMDEFFRTTVPAESTPVDDASLDSAAGDTMDDDPPF